MVDLDDSITQLPCDLVIDGILGIGGRPGLPGQVAQLAAASRARTYLWSPSTCLRASQPTPGRRPARRYTGHPHGDLWRGQALPSAGTRPEPYCGESP